MFVRDILAPHRRVRACTMQQNRRRQIGTIWVSDFFASR
jgi:hypothetical protein